MIKSKKSNQAVEEVTPSMATLVQLNPWYSHVTKPFNPSSSLDQPIFKLLTEWIGFQSNMMLNQHIMENIPFFYNFFLKLYKSLLTIQTKITHPKSYLMVRFVLGSLTFWQVEEVQEQTYINPTDGHHLYSASKPT